MKTYELVDDPERTPSHKASCTLTSIVAENSIIAVNKLSPFRRLQSPMLATISVTSVCCEFVVRSSRTDTSHKSRRRRTCEQCKRVDSLVLFTSPTTLCVVPVTCNNNRPILQHGGLYGQIG